LEITDAIEKPAGYGPFPMKAAGKAPLELSDDSIPIFPPGPPGHSHGRRIFLSSTSPTHQTMEQIGNPIVEKIGNQVYSCWGYLQTLPRRLASRK
jgi:hypothetical protein